jgi:phosphatidylinositol alpha 1,6-mannosyltransferase
LHRRLPDLDRQSPRRDRIEHPAQICPWSATVGRLAPEKQLDRLVALADLPGVRLVVVGDGPDAARLRGLLPTARFLGFRDGAELARIYASLDVFVHTGPSETFCQSVQEALASGVPVVAPDAGGPRDLVLPGRTGFLVPVRPEGCAADEPPAVAADAQLRAAVLRLADRTLRQRFGAAARTSVLRRSWSVLGDELLAHYADVIDRVDSAAAV